MYMYIHVYIHVYIYIYIYIYTYIISRDCSKLFDVMARAAGSHAGRRKT